MVKNMSLNKKVAFLIDQFERKEGKKATTIYIGQEDFAELDEIERKFKFNCPLSKYRMKKVIRGKRIRKPKFMGLRYNRSCLKKTIVCSWL